MPKSLTYKLLPINNPNPNPNHRHNFLRFLNNSYTLLRRLLWDLEDRSALFRILIKNYQVFLCNLQGFFFNGVYFFLRIDTPIQPIRSLYLLQVGCKEPYMICYEGLQFYQSDHSYVTTARSTEPRYFPLPPSGAAPICFSSSPTTHQIHRWYYVEPSCRYFFPYLPQ